GGRAAGRIAGFRRFHALARDTLALDAITGGRRALLSFQASHTALCLRVAKRTTLITAMHIEHAFGSRGSTRCATFACAPERSRAARAALTVNPRLAGAGCSCARFDRRNRRLTPSSASHC